MKVNKKIGSSNREIAVGFVLTIFLCLIVSTARAAEPVLEFTGNNSYVDLGMPEVLQFANNAPLTVEGWMYLETLGSRDMLYSKNDARNTSGYTHMFGFYENGRIAAYTGSAWREPSPTVTISAGQWYHAAFSFDGATMTYYLDGAAVGTSVFNFNNVEDNTVKLGGYHSGSDINGMKSDVRVWDHARSQEQIQETMNIRLTGAETGLIGYWPLNEGSGSTVYDGTANDMEGTVVNAEWVVAVDLVLTPADADFLPALPFTVADKVTGSTEFTNSNAVDIVEFPIPQEYDLFQITESGDSEFLGAWMSTSAVPDSVDFTQPSSTNTVTSTNITLYAWFTNSTGAVALRRAPGVIFYTESLPVLDVRATITIERLPDENVVIYPAHLDIGSSGGIADGREMEIVGRKLICAEEPSCDQTPGESFVTVNDYGDYFIVLWLQNEAGNTVISTTSMVSVVTYSGTNIWTGVGATDAWHDPANWTAGVPQAGQDVLIDSAPNVRLTGATAELESLHLAANRTMTVEGWESALKATEMTIAGTITHAAQTATEPDPATGEWVPDHRILLVGSNLTVTETGVLDADYVGYGPATGPGGVVRGGGYGHGGGGGYGGRGSSGFDAQIYGKPYGEPSDPWQPGSGGGRLETTGNGIAGGAIRIEMSGQVTIDGLLTARGQNGLTTHRTAASGGGIAIYCDTFQGAATGLIRVDGGRGNHYGGSGAGGRIAVHYDPAAQALLANPRPPVRFSAYGWPTSSRGDHWTVKTEMGTLYLPDLTLLAESPTSAAVLDGQRFWYTRLYIGDSLTSWSPESLVISNCVVAFPEGFELDVGTDLVLAGTQPPLAGLDVARAGLHLHAAQTNELYGARLRVGRDWTIGANTWFYPHGHWYSGAIVGVRVGRNVTIAAGGGIDADEKGYMPQSGNANGPGAGPNNESGGSYGGKGGGSSAAIREPYGLASLPLEPGSPGGWRARSNFTPTGKGGGSVHVLAGGDLTINGLVSANGGRGWYYRGPGGSGGSIFLSGWRVFGSGVLQASGGSGEGSRGPGGGGRIALWYRVPLDVVEERIADRNERGFAAFEQQPFTFAGSVDVSASSSVLTYQPEDGTVRFCTLTGTLLKLR